MPNDEGQVTDQTPAQAPVEEPTEQTEAPVEETPQEEPSQNQNEGAEAPEPEEEAPEETEQVEESDDYFDPMSQYPDIGQNKDIPVADDGTVDPYAFREQLKNEMREEMRFERQEQQRWAKIEKKYPGLTNDDRNLILNQRIAEAVQGKEGDIIKIADSLMQRIGAAKSQGRTDATTSRRVQKAAGLEKATANSGTTQNSNVLDRIADGDQGAADNLMAEWLEKGLV